MGAEGTAGSAVTVSALSTATRKPAQVAQPYPASPISYEVNRFSAEGGGAVTTSMTEPRRRRADRARQIADVLRHQVLSGAFPAGTLPAESQLCHDFAASRNTVREALGLGTHALDDYAMTLVLLPDHEGARAARERLDGHRPDTTGETR